MINTSVLENCIDFYNFMLISYIENLTYRHYTDPQVGK